MASDVSARAFLNMARQYHDAAEVLFAEGERRSKMHGHGSLEDPTYNYYLHAIELALKAYLRSYDLPILGTHRKTHNLTRLYDECRGLGLVIGKDDRFNVATVLALLDEGNTDNGFRYFNLRSTTMIPELNWTCEAVDALIHAVATRLDAHYGKDGPPGEAVKVTITLGKPVPA